MNTNLSKCLKKSQSDSIAHFTYEHNEYYFFPYPILKAFVRDVESKYWIEVSPDINVITGEFGGNDRYLLGPDKNKETDIVRSQIDKILNSIPEDILNIVSLFPDSHWQILKAESYFPKEFMQLVKSNILIAYISVNLDKFNPVFKFQDYRSFLNDILFRKQKEIINLARFPKTESCRKTLAKLEAEYISVKKLLKLRKFLWQKDELSIRIMKLLFHSQRIDVKLFLLITEHSFIFNMLDLQSIQKLSHDENYKIHLKSLNSISKNCRDYGVELPEIKSFDKIELFRRRIITKVNKIKKIIDFPPPPYHRGDNIIPIMNINQLKYWAEKQHNCIANYEKSIKSGVNFLYMIHYNNEEATLELKLSGNKFTLGTLLGTNNKKVSPGLKKMVQNWFHKNKIISDLDY